LNGLEYFPSRPTWLAESLDDALLRLGYSAEKAKFTLANAATDPVPLGGGSWSLVLDREGMPDSVAVLFRTSEEGVDADVVAVGHTYLAADTMEDAAANWPYANTCLITARPMSVGGRA